MPDPPSVGLLTRFLFENPYPVGLVLLAVAGGLLWTGLREGRRERLTIAVIGIALGAAVLTIGAVVVTSGERSRKVTIELVEAAVAADVVAMMSLFADEATMAFGSPTNPGFELDYLSREASRLESQYRIESNSITRLEAYTVSKDSAIVHLACRTTVERGYGPTPTQWVLQIQRQSDGTFKIVHVTWISLAGNPPPRR